MNCPKCGALMANPKRCTYCGHRQDLVNSPPHYTSHASGVECIEVTEAMDFNPGNAFKYVWRFREKGGSEDLAKALWYVRREIARQEGESGMDVALLRSRALCRAMAYETNPSVAMVFWYLTAGDNLPSSQGVEMYREAERLIEGLIHDTESATH